MMQLLELDNEDIEFRKQSLPWLRQRYGCIISDESILLQIAFAGQDIERLTDAYFENKYGQDYNEREEWDSRRSKYDYIIGFCGKMEMLLRILRGLNADKYCSISLVECYAFLIEGSYDDLNDAVKTNIPGFAVPRFFYENFYRLPENLIWLMGWLMAGKASHKFPLWEYPLTTRQGHLLITHFFEDKKLVKYIFQYGKSNGAIGVINYLVIWRSVWPECNNYYFISYVTGSARNIHPSRWMPFLKIMEAAKLKTGLSVDEHKKIITVIDFLKYQFGFNRNEYKIPFNADYNWLLERSERWHSEMNKYDVSLIPFVEWQSTTGITEYNTKFEGLSFRIIQITNSHALYLEGQKQRHCVYSYLDDVIQGYCIIYSLQSKVNDEWQPRVTIEVAENKVRQCSGFGNKRPEDQEIVMIEQWMQKNKIEWEEIEWEEIELEENRNLFLRTCNSVG